MSDVPSEISREKILLTQPDLILLISSVAAGLLYDMLLARSSAGLGCPLFITALALIVYKNTTTALVKRWSIGWFFGLSALLLSMTYFLYTNPLFQYLNAVVIPVLFIAHLLLVTGTNCYPWFHWQFLQDIARGFIVRPFKYLLQPFSLLWLFIKDGSAEADSSVPKRVFAGIIIALPLLVVMIFLLSSADLVFEKIMLDVLENISIASVIFHTLLVVLVSCLSFSFLLGLKKQEMNKANSSSENTGRQTVDAVIIATVLFLLALLYVMFCFIQFAYLFGSIAKYLPVGFSYAEYARKGFFELLAVTLINTCIVVCSFYFTRPAGQLLVKFIQTLNTIVLSSTFVMLISAFLRMSLYEEIFGYTYLRVLPHSFMVMIFFLLIVTLYRVWLGSVQLAKWYIIIGTVYYLLINFINIDVIIAQKNVERYYLTQEIDVQLLATLSDDAIPYLVQVAQASQGQVAAAAHTAIAERAADLSPAAAWQGYNLSRQQAKRFLTDKGLMPPTIYHQ